MYCSYCEFPIPHVPEVEHVVSKSKGGDLTDWNNLNLGCKYCNTRKKAQTIEYSCAVTPQVRQTGNRLSGLAGTAYASLLT